MGIMDLKAQVQQLVEKNQELKVKLDALERRTEGLTGNPLIQGYAGMRLTLNASLNVLELIKRMQDLSTAALASAKEHTDTATAETETDLTAINASISAMATSIYNIEQDIIAIEGTLSALYTGCTTNYLLKFNGTKPANSVIIDNGSVVTIGGALALKEVRTTSATYSIGAADYTIFCGTGCTAVNLPAGSSGRSLKLINCTAGDIIVTPSGTELLDGVNAAKTLGSGALDLIYNATEGWR
jgi:hypothetical protein